MRRPTRPRADRSTAWAWIALATVALTAMPGGRVRAEPPPAAPSDAVKATALATVREGNRLLAAGAAEAALAKFKEAHRLVGGDKLYYNFGQAYRAMPGHEVDAYEAFQTYIDRAKTAAPESLAAARGEQAEVRKKVALVTVATTPAGATVTVDRQARGQTPIVQSLVLAPGPHALHVEKAGYKPQDYSLVLTAGQTLDKDVELSLASAPSAATTTPLPRAPSPEQPLRLTATSPAAADGDAASPPIYRRWWFWTGLGAVAAAVLVVAITQGGGTNTQFVCPPAQQNCERL